MSGVLDGRKAAQAVASGSIRGIAQHVVVTYLLPCAIPVLTGWLGYIQDLPWMHIVLGVTAAFAFISVGLLRFDEWLFRRAIEEKLVFAQVLVGKTIEPNGINIGIRLQNSAHFPIDFQIERCLTRIGTTLPKEPYTVHQTHTVPANGMGWHYHGSIEVPNPPKDGSLDGYVEFEILYGRSGRLKYRLSGKKRIVIPFNSEGLLLPGSWSDAV